MSHHHRRAQRQASDQSASSASHGELSSSASASSEQHVINTADDAASLVAHAMAADDSSPRRSGIRALATRSDMDQKAFVHYDGQSPDDDHLHTARCQHRKNNDRVNSTLHHPGTKGPTPGFRIGIKWPLMDHLIAH